MPTGITLTDNGVLSIQRVKKEDEGMYECQAINAKGVTTSSAVITVMGEHFPFVITSIIQLQNTSGSSSKKIKSASYL